jgi:hypothetical protein
MKKVKTNKEVTYIKGRVLPIILIVLCLIFVATYFGTYIAGPGGFSVSGWDALSAVFNYPVIEKLGIETDSLYFTTFVAPSDILTRSWTGIADLLEFMSRYMMILALFISLINIIMNLVSFAKAAIKGRLTTKMHTNSGSLIVNSVLGALAIPAFQPDAPLPFIQGNIDFILFRTHYTMGMFFVAALFLGIVLFTLPYIVRAVLKASGKTHLLETVPVTKKGTPAVAAAVEPEAELE